MTDLKYISPSDVPEGVPSKISVDWLCLDPDNPRLILDESFHNDERIIERLYKTADLKELIQSFSANGYMDIEPLVVWLDSKTDKFVVIEGNRRLATLMLFRDHQLAASIKKQTGTSINVPELKDGLSHTLDTVTVYRVMDREDSRQFVGFKHINGTARWGSYAKAKFAADWYRKQPEKGLEYIAEMIGDKHNTVKRMVFAIYVLEQAQKEGLFSIEDRYTGRFGFSHLYVALTRSDYLLFLGLEGGWSDYIVKANPVPESNYKNLKEILLWFYGSKQNDIIPVIKSQNPHIKYLGEVISNEKSLGILIDTKDLERAHYSIIPKDRIFSKSLTEAEIKLAEAQDSIIGYDGSKGSLLETANAIKDRISIIHQIMEEKILKHSGGSNED